MDCEASEDRPDSPKKKLKPSSTTSEMTGTHSHIYRDSVSEGTALSNGICPTRNRNYFEASSSSENSTPTTSDESKKNPSSIQEEVVSSSESSVSCGLKSSYSEEDPDSLTNDDDCPVTNDDENDE